MIGGALADASSNNSRRFCQYSGAPPCRNASASARPSKARPQQRCSPINAAASSIPAERFVRRDQHVAGLFEARNDLACLDGFANRFLGTPGEMMHPRDADIDEQRERIELARVKRALQRFRVTVRRRQHHAEERMRKRELRIQLDRGPKLTFGGAAHPIPRTAARFRASRARRRARDRARSRARAAAAARGKPVGRRDEPVVRHGADRVAEPCIRRRVRRIEIDTRARSARARAGGCRPKSCSSDIGREGIPGTPRG